METAYLIGNLRLEPKLVRLCSCLQKSLFEDQKHRGMFCLGELFLLEKGLPCSH